MAHTKINRIESKRHTRRTFDQDDLVFASYLILKAPIHSSDTHLYFKTSSLLSHDCSIEHAKYCVVDPKQSSVLMYGASLFLCRLSSGVFLECYFLSPYSSPVCYGRFSVMRHTLLQLLLFLLMRSTLILTMIATTSPY